VDRWTRSAALTPALSCCTTPCCSVTRKRSPGWPWRCGGFTPTRTACSSILPDEAPHRDVRRQHAAVEIGPADRLAECRQRLPANADVIEVAPRVAHQVPDVVELVRLRQRVLHLLIPLPEGVPPAGHVRVIGTVEGQQLAHEVAGRKTHAVDHPRSVR